MLFVLFLSLSSDFSFSSGNETIRGIDSPEVAVKEFYESYLSAFNNQDTASSLSQSQSAVDKYTTKKLQTQRNLDDSGSDYFIAAQEICPDWIENIDINKVNVANNSAELELNLGYDESKSTYSIHLKKVNKKWLIDSVRFDSRKSQTCNQD